MRSFRTRLIALAAVLAGGLAGLSGPASAEVAGVHVNLTPYAGFATWGPDVNLEDKLLWGGRLGLGLGRYIGVEGTYGRSTPMTQEALGLETWTQPGFGVPPAASDAKFTHLAADLHLNLVPEAAINPYVFGGWATHKLEVDDNTLQAEDSYSGYNFGGGLKLHFSPRVALRLEARNTAFKFADADKLAGAPDGTNNNVLYTGGLQFSLGGDAMLLDTDGDLVPDKKDECPNTPVGCLVDARGCPIDSDGDGVCDGVDTCAGTPQGARVDASGCPIDSDGDGVFDGLDQCANTPAGCMVDTNGCPVDSDADGVCDGVDTCANTPQGARVDATGCPVDSDNDGVFDGLDLCPNTPEGARVDKDGCPIEITTRETEMLEKGLITERGILFETAKSDIRAESAKVLGELCAIFVQWPQLQIEIGGHTDARGSESYNQGLSEQRANSVLEWLRTNCPNINIANFSAKGYGEGSPIASNSTTTGMAQNRRVEFKVLNPEELTRYKERREMLMKDGQ